jgi:hypothetical protein
MFPVTKTRSGARELGAGNRSPSGIGMMPDQDFAILPNRAEWSLFYFEHSISDSVAIFDVRDFHALTVADIPAVGNKI